MGVGTGGSQGPGPPQKFYKLMKRIITCVIPQLKGQTWAKFI